MNTLYDQHPAMFRNRPVAFILSVLLIPVLVGALILAVWYLKTKASRLVVTSESILYEAGLLNKVRSEIAIEGIRSVKVSALFFERIFGVGTIEIFTAGDRPEIQISGMRDPESIRDYISQAQNRPQIS